MVMCTCADPQAVVRAINGGEAASLISGGSAYVTKSIDLQHQTLYGKALTDDPVIKIQTGIPIIGGVIDDVANRIVGTIGGFFGLGGGDEIEGDGEPGAPAPVRFCHWQAPEYGNTGENLWNLAFKGAAIAIAIANGLAQQEIADKQEDLAKSWYNQAKYKWDRFRDAYMPLEQHLLNEVDNTPVPVLDCDGAASRARQAVDTAYNSTDRFMKRHANAMRMCVDRSLLTSVNTRRAAALVDTENYNYADDRWYRDYKDDQRWNRRSQVLNLGRNMDAQALAYGQVANSMLKQVGGQIDRAANTAVSALGYFGARNDTYYPTTFLGSSGGSASPIVGIGTPTSISPMGISPVGYGG